MTKKRTWETSEMGRRTMPVKVCNTAKESCKCKDKVTVSKEALEDWRISRNELLKELEDAKMVLRMRKDKIDELEAKLIVTGTLSGYTARKLSNMKPNCIIFATCLDEKIARSLSLYYGVETKVVEFFKSTDDMIDNSINEAKKLFDLKEKDLVVVTGGFTGNMYETHTTNLMKIVEVK